MFNSSVAEKNMGKKACNLGYHLGLDQGIESQLGGEKNLKAAITPRHASTGCVLP